MKVSTKKMGLALVLLLSLTLLAACGSTPDPIQVNNDYTVPVYNNNGVTVTEFSQLANDNNFRSKVLVQDANTGPSDLKVFATSADLNAVKTFYSTEMPKRGWNDRSGAVIDATALGSEGWVLGFEKSNGANPPVTHVVGLYMFTPNSPALKDFKGALPPNNQNVLLQITGSSAK